MNEEELETLIASRKTVEDDVIWRRDQDHSLGWEFRVDCILEEHTMMVVGSCCKIASVVTFAIIHRPHGRVYGLDIGKDHRNQDGSMVGEKHKHKIKDGDINYAYEPIDITAKPDDLRTLWQQFCAEANIEHSGKFGVPEEYDYEQLF